MLAIALSFLIILIIVFLKSLSINMNSYFCYACLICICFLLSRKSLDLVETLLHLSDTPYFKEEVFKYPLTHCPDLLVLGLIQTSVSILF